MKPGYCYHIAEVEDLLPQDCNACQKDASCSHCTSDAGCPGATKCCPSKCGYTCQEPVLGKGSVSQRWEPSRLEGSFPGVSLSSCRVLQSQEGPMLWGRE